MSDDPHPPPPYGAMYYTPIEPYTQLETGLGYTDQRYETTPSWTGGQYENHHHNRTVPNVNQWTGSESSSAHVYNNMDEEVTYFTNLNTSSNATRAFERCESTDTTFSSSSQSTVHSYDSVNELDSIVDWNITELQKDRKRKRRQNEAKRAKKQGKSESLKSYQRWPKPPFSYHGIIATIIWNSKTKSLSLHAVFDEMMRLFPFFQGSYTGWRNSVRNYLSKTPCFVKEQCHAKVSMNSPWTLDLTKLTPRMFLRQDNRADAEKYAPTIHEHLNLSPVPVPQIATMKPRKTCDRSTKLSELRTQTPTPIQEVFDEVVHTSELNVTLPSVDSRCSQIVSPFSMYAYERQESEQAEDLTQPCTGHVTTDTHITPTSSTMGNWAYDEPLYDVRRLVESEPRAPLDAVELLQSLCFAETDQTGIVSTNSEHPINICDRDSDANVHEFPYMKSDLDSDVLVHVSPNLKPDPDSDIDIGISPYMTPDVQLEVSEHGETNHHRYTDFSISGLFSPPSPVMSRRQPVARVDVTSEKFVSSDSSTLVQL